MKKLIVCLLMFTLGALPVFAKGKGKSHALKPVHQKILKLAKPH